MTNTDLAQASNLLVYASMLALSIAMLAFAVSMAADKNRRFGNIGMSLTWLAAIFLAGALLLRGLWASRVPWGNMYEYALGLSLGALVVFLVISLRRDVRWLGIFVVAPVLLLLGIALVVLYSEAAQLVPALQSYWIVLHVPTAVVASGAFTVSAATAGLSLVRSRAERKAGDEPVSGLAGKLPSAERLRVLTNRVVMFGFPLWTFTVIAGAIWAENAWGRYWGWDPKETWAFITWVIYAAYLHARSTAGWRGDRASWIALIGFIAFLINFFGVNLFAGGLHSYAGV